jgi:DNA-binding NtrC family response regulator
MVGGSAVMRAVFAILERAAPTAATILLEGETGTGKGAAAESIHRASDRAEKPFVVVDCSAIPATLLESELFGHEKGAFTGAAARRVGAFEEADGGTIFLDELGELPLDLQPKLLRALEERAIRRVGSNLHRPVDLRVIAATNRDLRSEVNAGRFRADLYYRLAVVRVTLPALRNRTEDLPLLVGRLLHTMRVTDSRAAFFGSSEFISRLQGASWPGNVRELRNYVERCLVFQDSKLEANDPTPAVPAKSAAGVSMKPGFHVDAREPYSEERRRVIDEFEGAYLTSLMNEHQGRTVFAARAAGLDRVYLYRLLRKHGLIPSRSGE